jgi:GDP-L-fucose synthase
MVKKTGFWERKSVLVTGGSGFLGKYVVSELEKRGCINVFVPSHREYDLVVMENVIRVMDVARPDIIIHLAARVGGIGANRREPGRFFYDNLMMGTQLMEVARRRGVEKFVTVGTVCSYPKYTPLPFREEDIWEGYPEETNAPYGLAKKMLLVQGQAYRRQYGFNAIYLILANLYGPGDHDDLERSHVIPALIRKFREATECGAGQVVVWGDGTPTREFLYVEDAARAIVTAAEKYNRPDPVNIGSGEEVSIKELAEMIADFTGFQGEIVWDLSKPNGQPRRRIDSSRAWKEFGFKSRVTFKEGLERIFQQVQPEGRSYGKSAGYRWSRVYRLSPV